jgi:tRNA nucleotidyltransferase (CCA-adding enzyme)
MEMIVTHVRADFDAFASMLCACKLYPGATAVMPSTTVFKLRELLSLYRDVADFRTIRHFKKLGKNRWEKVIVVDTKKRNQLMEFDSFLQRDGRRLLIFDHHPPTSDDLTWGELNQFRYGANATGLFLQLTDRGVVLNPQEATIVLLGIYADTGNLTYPGTTAEDARVVSDLLQLGADLKTVNHYLRPYYDPAQRSVFREMLASLEEVDMEGYKVVSIKQRLDAPMHGISVLLSNVSDIVGADAIMGAFSSDGKPGVQLILQSLVPEINAMELLGHFGGGGHKGAAAAFLPRGDMDAVAETMMTLLTEVPLPCIKVKDVMTTEVVTMSPDTSLEEAEKLLVVKGIQGAPVVNGEVELVGVISLRDVEKARHQDLLHAPVSGFISSKVITIQSDAPLIAARKLISSHDIGRLPVLEGEELVGIVSRSDILGALNDNPNQMDKQPKT